MAFHPLGTARADARASARRHRRRPRAARRRGRLRRRRLGRAERARRQPAADDHGARHAPRVSTCSVRAYRASAAVGSRKPRTRRGGPMSFLIDPPWLYATGRAYGRLMPERTPAARARQTATAGVFLATSISLYLNRPLDAADLGGAAARESGRDWMLNSGVFRLDHRRAEPARARGLGAALRDLPAVAAAGRTRRARQSASAELPEPGGATAGCCRACAWARVRAWSAACAAR